MDDQVDLIQEFRHFLLAERRASAHTVAAYCTDVAAFVGFLESEYGLNANTQIADLARVTLRMVRNWLGTQELARSSQSRKVAAIRRFFKFQLVNGRIEANPVARLTNPKAEKRIPTYVPSNELNPALDKLQSATGPDSEFCTARDNAIIELLYSTGIRRAELIGIRLTDIDLKSKYVTVTGKGNKERRVPFGQPALKAILHYLTVANQAGIVVNHALFVTEKGKPLYAKLVYRIVHNFLSHIPGVRKASPHVLRHSFATHLVDANAELPSVQQMLGHSRLGTTRLYVHAAVERIKSVHNQAHPHAE